MSLSAVSAVVFLLLESHDSAILQASSGASGASRLLHRQGSLTHREKVSR